MKVDQGIESTELLIAEIDTLLRRLIDTDANAMLIIDEMIYKIRKERIVERVHH